MGLENQILVFFLSGPLRQVLLKYFTVKPEQKFTHKCTYNEICMYYFITFLARVSLKLYKLFTCIVQIIPETGNDFHISF